MKKILIFALAAALILTGCQTGGSETSDEQIYYISQDGKGLFSTAVNIEANGSDDWITDIKDALNEGQNVPMECLSLKSYNVSILSTNLIGNILYVDFSSEFNSLETKDKLLIIAMTVKTFTQQTSVASVKFTVGEVPITNDSGEELLAFNSDSFVDESNDLINNFTKTKMTLYFISKDGQKLTTETKDVYYSVKTLLGQSVLDALKKGPDEAGNKSVLDPGVNILNVTVQDNFCYVNFDETFLNQPLDTDPKLSIYAIVNSICAVCDVDGVSFSVNGSNEVMYKDTIDLKQKFSPDETLTED